jgi:hypothetical protein
MALPIVLHDPTRKTEGDLEAATLNCSITCLNATRFETIILDETERSFLRDSVAGSIFSLIL